MRTLMSESDFIGCSDRLFADLQVALDDSDLAQDHLLQDGILTLDLDNGTKIIINRHVPNREIWVAAKMGGFHFAWDGEAWLNTRDGGELHGQLSAWISTQAGEPFVWLP